MCSRTVQWGSTKTKKSTTSSSETTYRIGSQSNEDGSGKGPQWTFFRSTMKKVFETVATSSFAVNLTDWFVVFKRTPKIPHYPNFIQIRLEANRANRGLPSTLLYTCALFILMKLFSNRGAFRALSYPDFFWFWSSYFVSNVGSWMQSIAQGWLLFELTSSPFYLGLFSSLRMVLLLCFFVLGGLMSDRWERRKVMLWIQVISALTALGLALLVSSKTIEVWHIFVLGAITSTTWAFEQPVRQALIPQLVQREDLVNALALNAVVWNGAGFLGPSTRWATCR